MSDEFTFRTQSEEVKELAHELAQVKGLLKEISLKVAQIEKHAKRALGDLYPSKGNAGEKSRGSKPKKKIEATIKPDQVSAIFDELTNLWKTKGGGAVEERLISTGLPDLVVIAQELGALRGSKPSRKSLQVSIVGRINESIMLSTNITAAGKTNPETPIEPASGVETAKEAETKSKPTDSL